MKALLTLVFAALTLSLYAQLAPGNKTTAMQQRLVAKSVYMDTSTINNPVYLAIYDSARFTYSGERHSVVDYNTMDYFDLNKLAGNQALVNFFYTPAAQTNIDSPEIWPRAAFDTFIHYASNHPIYGNDPEIAEICTYNNDGSYRNVDHWYYSWKDGPELSYRQALEYQDGRPNWMIIAPGNSLDRYWIRYIIRDAQGRIITDSSMAYEQGRPTEPQARTIYQYNSASQYLSRLEQQWGGDSFVSVKKYINTYYPDGRLQSSVVEYPPNFRGQLRPRQVDSFWYMPNVAGYTRYTVTYFDDQGKPFPVPNYVYKVHLNAANQKDTIVRIVYTGDSLIQIVHYNGYGNPDVNDYYYYYRDGHLGHRWKFYYYYELFNSTGVSGHTSHSDNIAISPNPTTGLIILRCPGAKPGIPILVRITNSTGQLMLTESFEWHGTSQQIQVGSEAPPGIYYISVYANGNLLGGETILKQ